LRLREKKEKELEKQRGEMSNSYMPTIEGKEWRSMIALRQIKPPEEAVKQPKVVKPVD
jgi:hypothetical protein